jgi:SAM-dependent methyltransferase
MDTTPPRLFDRALLASRRARARRLGPATFLAERANEDLAERLSMILRPFPEAADLASALPITLPGRTLARVEPAALDDPAVALPLTAKSLDLVVSVLGLQEVDDLPGVLAQVRRSLRPDGLFLAAMMGGETLTELRQAFMQAEVDTAGGVSPRVFPFVDVRDLGGLLQRAGFTLPVTDTDRVTVRYRDLFSLFADLRAMGATNILIERSRRPLPRATLARLAEIYAERFADADGRLRATFDVVWLSGWAAHDSQQQPLKPGSAKARLADALKVEEHGAGEKAGE